jgi:hypothetical protein
MSARLPAGSAFEDGSVNGRGGAGVTDVSGGVACSIDAPQQAHVHRTQNAGQPLSGADSLVPIGHVSGTRSELTPLASAMSTASTAMNNTRRMPANISVGATLKSVEPLSTTTDEARTSSSGRDPASADHLRRAHMTAFGGATFLQSIVPIMYMLAAIGFWF